MVILVAGPAAGSFTTKDLAGQKKELKKINCGEKLERSGKK